MRLQQMLNRIAAASMLILLSDHSVRAAETPNHAAVRAEAPGNVEHPLPHDAVAIYGGENLEIHIPTWCEDDCLKSVAARLSEKGYRAGIARPQFRARFKAGKALPAAQSGGPTPNSVVALKAPRCDAACQKQLEQEAANAIMKAATCLASKGRNC